MEVSRRHSCRNADLLTETPHAVEKRRPTSILVTIDAVPKEHNEFRDPVHTFVIVGSDERKVINSRAFQRLRHIHQLALTWLVYPAATHKRFEHSLGVMQVAGNIFDVLTRAENRRPSERLQQIFPSADPSDAKHQYWRSVVRM